jgi:hypothetical protein
VKDIPKSSILKSASNNTRWHEMIKDNQTKLGGMKKNPKYLKDLSF